MREVTINEPKEMLRVNIGDEHFDIPLATSLPFQELQKFRKATAADKNEILMSFLEAYIPEHIYKKLTGSEVTQIMKAWSDATLDTDGGLTPGES